MLTAWQKRGTIRDGKISFANREEEKEGKGVDESGEVQYNDSEIQFARKSGGRDRPVYVQWESDAMAWANKHDTEIGDQNFGADENYYYFYEAIDPDNRGKASDYKVIERVSIHNDALAKNFVMTWRKIMYETEKAFIRILLDIEIPGKTIDAIVQLLWENYPAMDALVDWIEENPQRTEKEVIKKATALCRGTSTMTAAQI